MKKNYTLLLAFMLLMTTSFAQKGLNLGLNGQYTGITIVNQNSWGIGEEYDYAFTTGSSFGFDVGYNFTDEIGIYSGFGMMTLGQDYLDTYKHGENEVASEWERNVRLKYNVLPIMFKFTGSETRVNFIGGFGVMFAFLKEAEQTWTQDGSDYTEVFINEFTDKPFNMGAADVTDRFETMDIMVNLELGARIFIIDDLYVDATVNLAYGLKDINGADWQMEDTDGHYNASHNAFGGVKVGVGYVLFGE